MGWHASRSNAWFLPETNQPVTKKSYPQLEPKGNTRTLIYNLDQDVNFRLKIAGPWWDATALSSGDSLQSHLLVSTQKLPDLNYPVS
jgi:hypothetical protein